MSIEKRGKSYRATAYKSGIRQRKTFRTKSQAMAWILEIEKAESVAQIDAKGKTFADLLILYRDTITPTKKACRAETIFIRRILDDDVSNKLLVNVTQNDLSSFFSRIGEMSEKTGRPMAPASIARIAAATSAIFSHGAKIKWIKENPMKGFKMPKGLRHRERIATPEETQKLKDVVGWDGVSAPVSYKQRVVAAFVFSTLTGMRLGEISKTRREWVDGRVIHLPDGTTKTEAGRDVALSKKAMKLLDLMSSLNFKENIFGINPAVSSMYFNHIRNAAGLDTLRDANGFLVKEGLNFHDGRATFATRAAKHLTPFALARQLGHTDLKMTMRYYRSRPEQVAELLDKD